MNDERLWAPWRLAYVRGEAQKPAPPEPLRLRDGADAECFMCRAAGEYAEPAAARRALLATTVSEHAVVLLNRYPYNNGHLLVCPARHVARLDQLTPQEQASLLQELARYVRTMEQLMRAEGFNIGLNLGQAAGAGVPGHLHWHLVPRWSGDNNFMPVVAETRILSQSLDALWEALVAAPTNP